MASTLASPRTRPQVRGPLRRMDLAALHGEVHRFSGIVDRFGSFACGEQTVPTICIRSLRLEASAAPVQPDHWWFPLRDIWSEAGVRAGDTVLFTAKVQRCSKGSLDPDAADQPEGTRGRRCSRPREQVIGFGRSPRSVVVTARAIGSRAVVQEVLSEKAAITRHLDVARAELERSTQHRDALLADIQRLQDQLHERDDRLAHNAQAITRLLQRIQRRCHSARRKAALAALLALVVGLGGGLVIGSGISGGPQQLPSPHWGQRRG
ncbi:hypothetical protein [Cyanobium sp. CH-040]|uniref:hypothetical protein n=1 Tax=Cyanobium sp. CH-040 TaxID=2823708 RepID=UPI0020CB7270|nr:hypothetical protein [Cyanobium sp. CH-040]MCP9928822.1 hypothetical protein [Cyanobium sp. CH-040]